MSAPLVADIEDQDYMSAHVILNLSNEIRNEYNKFNNTRASILDSIYHMTLKLL